MQNFCEFWWAQKNFGFADCRGDALRSKNPKKSDPLSSLYIRLGAGFFYGGGGRRAEKGKIGAKKPKKGGKS